MTSEELVLGLEAATAQVAKIGVESAASVQKVADLEVALAEAIAAGSVIPSSVTVAFEALKAQVQVVDDLVPDPQP
jgi:hypothetical protein